MTNFSKNAHHFLGTGLQCQLTEDLDIDFDFDLDFYPQKGTIWTLSGVNDKGHLFENGKAVPFLLTRGAAWIGPDETQFKPKMRSLNKLTQPIRVEGESEPFVPMVWLEDEYYTLDLHKQAERLIENPNWLNQTDFMLVQQLLSWRFNCFSVPEGEFIEIDETTNTPEAGEK